MGVRFIEGDCRSFLPEIPDDSFGCIVTSPPYLGLRDYGVSGQLGREGTMQEYLASMVAVCRELRRVLDPTGTFWLNIGDSWANDGKWGGRSGGQYAYLNDMNQVRVGRNKIKTGLKPKDLTLMPARLALLLQEDGWWVRSHIIWYKTNAMPSGVKDRPVHAYDEIFLLTKSARYFYDADAVRVPALADSVARRSRRRSQGYSPPGQPAHKGTAAARPPTRLHRNSLQFGLEARWDKMTRAEQRENGANLRDVWEIAPESYPGHPAVFPSELVRRCLLAGCPPGARVLDPFAGSGTVGVVADQLGYDATLIELSPEYIDLAKERLDNDAPLLNTLRTDEQLPLFTTG